MSHHGRKAELMVTFLWNLWEKYSKKKKSVSSIERNWCIINRQTGSADLREEWSRKAAYGLIWHASSYNRRLAVDLNSGKLLDLEIFNTILHESLIGARSWKHWEVHVYGTYWFYTQSLVLIFPAVLSPYALPQRTGMNSCTHSSLPWRSAWEKWWTEQSNPWHLYCFRNWPTVCPSVWCWLWEETLSSVRRWVPLDVCTEHCWIANALSLVEVKLFAWLYF